VSPRPTAVRWEEVTAVFGGTFDPPHLGHRMAVAGLFAIPGVARVLVVPSPSPPHKPTVADVDARLAMTRLNFAPSLAYPLPGPVELELCELERAWLNPGKPTYSFDTLGELKRRIPNLAFVIGTDQLQKLHTWHRFPEVLSLCHWIVLERREVSGTPSTTGGPILTQWEASGLIQKEGTGWRIKGSPGSQIHCFPTPAPALSSTQIRESLARHGKAPENSLLPEVLAHLMQRRIYGT
jgi:nicotinate-nucleotide adenylyltransferase